MGVISHAGRTAMLNRSGPIGYSDALSLIGHNESETGRLVALPLSEARKSAAWKDALADTPGSSELGLADTLGSPLAGTTTNGGATATGSDSALWLVALPSSYAAGESVKVRIRAKVTAARTVSATIDAVVKKISDGAAGSDICATAAQSINSTTYANKEFTITATSLSAGDLLAVQITAAADDTGGSANGIAHVAGVWLVLG